MTYGTRLVENPYKFLYGFPEKTIFFIKILLNYFLLELLTFCTLCLSGAPGTAPVNAGTAGTGA